MVACVLFRGQGRGGEGRVSFWRGLSWAHHAIHCGPAAKQGGCLEGIPCLYRVGRCRWLQRRLFGRHPLSLRSWLMKVIAGRPAFLLPWLGKQCNRLLASSCFTRQQWPAKRILHSCKIVEMSGMGPWSRSLVGCLQFGEGYNYKIIWYMV